MRLRQIALVARHLRDATAVLEGELGFRDPFADPGVGEFGLENAVYAVGTSFVEVVAPVRPDTTAGRYLDRRGSDGGYMAIFQVDDLAVARQRVAELGIRVVWSADLPDIAGTHLHPKDVPGAIVSLDWADPPESWHWAGPAWRGGAPDGAAGGIVGLTVAASDPEALAARWASVLGVAASDPTTIDLGDGGQRIVFTSGTDGIVGVELAVPGDGLRTANVGNVRIEMRGGS